MLVNRKGRSMGTETMLSMIGPVSVDFNVDSCFIRTNGHIEGQVSTDAKNAAVCTRDRLNETHE